MKLTRLIKDIPAPFPIEATQANIAAAREFALSMWRERWAERKADWESKLSSPFTENEPADLSGSCKFTSVFAAAVFGGGIDGNYDHQFAVFKGGVIDLNDFASDVTALTDPYRCDTLFFGSKDHMKSMKSCLPRIENWIGSYAAAVNTPTPGPQT
jgi:hypothetical protein